jgi:hypothetical protein
MISDVDVLIVSRDAGPLRPDVQSGIEQQRGVRVKIHRVTAAPRADDPHRWETIARGRNQARRLGTAPWAMFLDDDVVLEPHCIRTLVEELGRRPQYGALAADYLGESRGTALTMHVAMGATLFRRSALRQITFRWEPGKCECRCCCDDLRRIWQGIAYAPEAIAWHRQRARPAVAQVADCGASPIGTPPGEPAAARRSPSTSASGGDGDESPAAATNKVIMTAFDRRHYDLFRHQFLASLRAAGNRERVVAVAYGLYAHQQRTLASLRNVEVLALPMTNQVPARRRLHDFQTVVEQLPPGSLVAYWDAGDVAFQAPLTAMWELARRHPDRLLASREAWSHPENPIVAKWTLSVANPIARRELFDLMSRRPFLAAGFAVATAPAMLRYLRYAHRLRESGWLAGTTNRGDAVCFNYYCHSHPDEWLEISDSWNYCVVGRPRRAIYLHEGRYVSTAGDPIYVIHGNCRSLPTVPRRPRRF